MTLLSGGKILHQMKQIFLNLIFKHVGFKELIKET